MHQQSSSARFSFLPSGTALGFNPIDPNTIAIGTNTSAVCIYDSRHMGKGPVRKITPEFPSPGRRRYPGETTDVSGLAWDERNRIIVNYCRQDIIEIDLNCYTDEDDTTAATVGSSDLIPRSWSGRVNHQTFLKEVAIMGKKGEYILSGGDCGNLFVWSRFMKTLLMKMPADPYVLNCVAVNPKLPILATSGIASVADIWEPIGAPNLFDGTDSDESSINNDDDDDDDEEDDRQFMFAGIYTRILPVRGGLYQV